MSVINETQRQVYQGDGVSTAFDVDFKIQNQEHLYVAKKVIATGVVTEFALSTNYTVELDEDEGATVTMLVAPAVGETLYIYPDAPETQELEIEPDSNFPEGDIETAFDKAIILIKQLSEKLSRSLKFARTSSSYNIEPVLPDEPEDGKALVWDGVLGVMRNSTSTIDSIITTATALAAASAASAAAADASADAASASAVAADASADAAAASEAAAALSETAAETAETNAELAETNAEAAQAAAEAAQAAAEQAADDAETTLAQGIPSVDQTVTQNTTGTAITGEVYDPLVYSSVEYICEIKRGTTVFGHLYFSLMYFDAGGGDAWHVVVSEYRTISGLTFSHGVTFSMDGNQLEVDVNNGAGNADLKLKKNAFTI